MLRSLTIIILLAALLLTALPSSANEQGKKHTTITLGAASVLSILTHHPTLGLLSGVGAAYSYTEYQREHNLHMRQAAYRQGYHKGQRDARAATTHTNVATH